MKIVTNLKLVKRNAHIGQYTSIGALVILAAGLYITFKWPDKYPYSLGCLLLGFLLSQFGIYYGNRWGRTPRPDEIIDKSLKGMGRDYTIYHYVTPAAHVLVGPAGLWVILPYYQGGTISYDGKRWRARGGGFARSYMRLFGQESIGRPEVETDVEVRSVTRELTRLLPEATHLPAIHPLMLFTDPTVILKVESSPIPAMLSKDLKDFLKEKAKEDPAPDLLLDQIRKALPKPEKEED
jgi:hypothetical protein